MDILYLSIVFLVIVVIIWLKKPLFVAMIGGIAATIILFRVNLKDAAVVLGRQTVAWDTIDVLLSFYLIIFLQLMLEKKGRLTNAKDSFNRLLRNRQNEYHCITCNYGTSSVCGSHDNLRGYGRQDMRGIHG